MKKTVVVEAVARVGATMLGNPLWRFRFSDGTTAESAPNAQYVFEASAYEPSTTRGKAEVTVQIERDKVVAMKLLRWVKED